MTTARLASLLHRHYPRDYILAVDASSSMGIQMPNGQTRWAAVAEAAFGLAQAIEQAGSAEATPVAAALEHVKLTFAGQTGWMRPTDHQFQQTLVVGLMDRQGTPGVPFDVEGSGYGFRVVRVLQPAEAEMPTSCRMVRPA